MDEMNAIVRAWYLPAGANSPREATFVDVWLRGVTTKGLTGQSPLRIQQAVRAAGNQLIDTTCGKRSFVVLETVDRAER